MNNYNHEFPMYFSRYTQQELICAIHKQKEGILFIGSSILEVVPANYALIYVCLSGFIIPF